jgi:hypothetical protein
VAGPSSWKNYAVASRFTLIFEVEKGEGRDRIIGLENKEYL